MLLFNTRKQDINNSCLKYCNRYPNPLIMYPLVIIIFCLISKLM